MAKQVTVCCQLFYPELISTGQTLTELCEVLADLGVQVQVLSGPPTLLAHGAQPPSRMRYKDIDIRRVWGTRFSKLSLWGRVTNQLSYTLSMFFALLFQRDRNPMLVITNPPFLTFVCALISRIQKRPMIYVMFDVYPDTAVQCGVLTANSLMVQVWERWNQFCFDTAASIVVLGRCMQARVGTKLSDKNREKLTPIHMWCDDVLMQTPSDSPNPFIVKWGLEGKTVVLYSGNMGRFHDMETLLEAAQLLQAYTDLVFIFVGEGHKKEWAQRFVNTQGLLNCQFHSYVPREALPHLMAAADIGLVCLMPGQEGLSVPSKTFGLMAAGLPVVAVMAQTSEIALVLSENHCGLVTQPLDPQACATAILELYQNPEKRKTMGQLARQVLLQKYTLKAAAEAYQNLF